MAALSGPDAGRTVTSAAVPAGFGCGGVTRATSGSPRTSAATAAARAGGAGAVDQDQQRAGDARPELAAEQVVGCGLGGAGGGALAEAGAQREERHRQGGQQRRPRPAAPASGGEVTARRPAGPEAAVGALGAGAASAGAPGAAGAAGRGGPVKPSTAGTRVIATSTATTMVAAAARPISVRNGMPAIDSPASAMTTVMPAVTTRCPAVPTASRDRLTDVRAAPAAPGRSGLTMNSA